MKRSVIKVLRKRKRLSMFRVAKMLNIPFVVYYFYENNPDLIGNDMINKIINTIKEATN